MPDLASVRVAVDGESQTREDAYRMAATTAAAVDDVLATFEAAIDRVTTTALAVQPKTRWRKGESQRTGWQAFRASVIEIRDTARVAELLNALAGAGASIDELSWMVAPGNESFALARQRAGANARARAEQYAQALGVKLGPVAWAAEPGLRNSDHSDRSPAYLAAALPASAGGAAEEPITANPEEVTIRADIEVGFRILSDDSPPNG